MFSRIFNLLIFFFSILLAILIYFKSEIVWEGVNRGYYFPYYILSFLLFLFSILFFFSSKEFKTYSIIFSLSAVSALYIFELILINQRHSFITIADKKNKEIKAKEYKKKFNKDYDMRNRFQIYQDYLKVDTNIALSIGPEVYLKYEKNKKIKEFLLPLSGKSKSKTIVCNELGEYSTYESDRYGFNNPDEVWNNSEVGFVLLGDSFVMGSCVNRPNDIASILRNLSKQNVINLGNGSNGTLSAASSLFEYSEKKIDNVIFFHTEHNDLEDLNRDLESKILYEYFKNYNFSQNLISRQNEINEVYTKIVSLALNEYTQNLNENKFLKLFKFRGSLNEFIKLRQTRNFLLYFLPETYHPNSYKRNKRKINYSAFENIIRNIKLKSNELNANLYFVYLPTIYRYNSERHFLSSEKEYQKVKEIVGNLEIQFIDIKKMIDNSDNPKSFYPFEMEGHYTIEGYRKVTNYVFNKLKK